MKPTIPFLRERFAHFNSLVFAGRLPEVPITLCAVSSFVAQYKHKDGNHLIRFSTAFDLSERELEDTLIHEMIHFFISINGLHDRSAHGPLFKAMMQSVNEAHGRAITISHRTTHGEIADARAASARKWHVIAILHFSSGDLGVKVLPRVVPRIIDYFNSVSTASNIRSVDLYLHNDPFFNRFPTSTGRRCHTISEADMNRHLNGAHSLVVEKGRLVQK